MFKVEKKVPMPESRGRPSKYPFADMEIGDSFAVIGVTCEAVRDAASKYGRRNESVFTVRRTEDGSYRCWRIE